MLLVGGKEEQKGACTFVLILAIGRWLEKILGC